MKSITLYNQTSISWENYTEKVFDSLDISKTTKDEYKYRITQFIDFIKDTEINVNTYLDYKHELKNRIDYSVSTKNKYLATSRIFLKELHRRGVLPVDITTNIKVFKQNKKHKQEGLNDSEIQRINQYCQTLELSRESTRINAILSLLINQGLRQVEISRLNVRDIDLIQRTALVQGKGCDDKEPIPLHPKTIASLKTYFKVWKISDGSLFISTSNRSKNTRLSPRSIRMLIHNVLVELEIEKTVHGFRHYFTTKLIDAFNGNILEVAKLTRHRNLEMLQVYYDKINFNKNLPTFYNAF